LSRTPIPLFENGACFVLFLSMCNSFPCQLHYRSWISSRNLVLDTTFSIFLLESSNHVLLALESWVFFIEMLKLLMAHSITLVLTFIWLVILFPTSLREGLFNKILHLKMLFQQITTCLEVAEWEITSFEFYCLHVKQIYVVKLHLHWKIKLQVFQLSLLVVGLL